MHIVQTNGNTNILYFTGPVLAQTAEPWMFYGLFWQGRRGFGNSSKCRKKFGASLCFSSANFPANFVSVHFVWRFTANFVSVRGTETGGAQRRAASAKQLHFSSPHWPLVNNGGFLGKETVKR